jgi:MFS family permease
LLYAAYNLAATLISVPAGLHGDRHGATRVLASGAACFATAYLWFAIGPTGVVALAPAFILAGIGIGCAETAEHAAVATLAPQEIRGSAFGLLAGIQAAGNLGASTIAGVLWTAVSPGAAFIFLAIAMVIALPLIVASTRT